MSINKKTRVLISFDYALKNLLRNKANYDVLEGFLSELLMQDVKVKNIVESEGNQTSRDDKQNRVDIMIENDKDELIIVELQFSVEFDYLLRMLYGVGKATTEYMKQGADYAEVRKIYSINIVYFDLGEGEDYIYHGTTIFKGLHTQDELRLSARQRELLSKEAPGDLYPEYYILRVNRFNDMTKDKLDEWMYFLKHNAIKDEFSARGLDKARAILAYEQLTPAERAEFDYLQNERSHKLSMVASARYDGWYDGREEGREEGREVARQEYEPVIVQQKAVLDEKDAALTAERKALAEKDKILDAKDAALAQALAELAALKNSSIPPNKA
jgi:predicted transposase/invertase (TIGR01784 family)